MDEALATATGAEGAEVRLYDDRVEIERPGGRFGGVRTIPLSDLTGVRYDGPGFLGAGQVRFEQRGVELDDGGLLRQPVDGNTVHFPAVATPEFRRFARRARERLGRNE